MATGSKKIDYRFKILYVVGIYLVCASHAQGGGLYLLTDWFPYTGFQVALFVFCSGYFYKSDSESHVGRYIWKKIKTLIVPLYLYTIIYGLIVQLLRTKGFTIGADFTLHNIIIMPLIDGHQFGYNLGGWFITPFF